MILETFIPDLAFSSQVSNIVLSSDSDVKFVLYRVTESGENEAILSELYTPDNDSKIYILNLQKILSGYLEPVITGDFVFSFVVDDETLEYTSRLILSRSEINVSAPKFVANKFLSLLMGDKVTRPNNKEYVSVYSLTEDTVNVKAYYRDNETQTYSEKDIAGNQVTKDTVTLLDVSPGNYEAENLVLVRYIVSCGDRSMTFWIDNLSESSALSVLFSNNFGVLETFSISGVLQWEPKYTNDIGTIRGEYNKYNIDFYREYTANTGVLERLTADWLELELFSSLYVFEMRDTLIGKRIMISDQTVKRSSSKTETPSFEFKYRISQRIQDVIDFAGFIHRIFDMTFDLTFD
ncbi:hypothetical protein [Dysgonomonas macrotermitis]|uniref:Uncharacterized protein n=1 Tax=Dysgonomonas macrotermitis TaxID=1346286 RepID=A0A1M4UJ12_9BACT|nr:hypothetical protein [Dysgonomonas macrotermitis]SHE56772.1 hypothetical protein SAMN05444362_101620 [Dysgonomonas macrotermitis]